MTTSIQQILEPGEIARVRQGLYLVEEITNGNFAKDVTLVSMSHVDDDAQRQSQRFQSPFRAGIKLEACQLEPPRKALRLPCANLFLADDVGLGKTIEAGLIARDLLLRKRIREIVVSAPAAKLEQCKGCAGALSKFRRVLSVKSEAP